MRRCTRCGMTEAEVESSAKGRGPAYDGYCEEPKIPHPAGAAQESQHYFTHEDGVYWVKWKDGGSGEPFIMEKLGRSWSTCWGEADYDDESPSIRERLIVLAGPLRPPDTSTPTEACPHCGTTLAKALPASPERMSLRCPSCGGVTRERVPYTAPTLTPVSADDPRAIAHRLAGAIERAGFRVAPDILGVATLWCTTCRRDSGYHLSTCEKAEP